MGLDWLFVLLFSVLYSFGIGFVVDCGWFIVFGR